MIITTKEQIINLPEDYKYVEIYLHEKDIIRYKEIDYVVLGKFWNIDKKGVSCIVTIEEREEYEKRILNYQKKEKSNEYRSSDMAVL